MCFCMPSKWSDVVARDSSQHQWATARADRLLWPGLVLRQVSQGHLRPGQCSREAWHRPEVVDVMGVFSTLGSIPHPVSGAGAGAICITPTTLTALSCQHIAKWDLSSEILAAHLICSQHTRVDCCDGDMHKLRLSSTYIKTYGLMLVIIEVKLLSFPTVACHKT